MLGVIIIALVIYFSVSVVLGLFLGKIMAQNDKYGFSHEADGISLASKSEKPLSGGLEIIVINTIATMTFATEKRDEWRKAIVDALQNARNQGPDWQLEVEFLSAVLALLDKKIPLLPDDHPYAQVLAEIQAGIAHSTTGGSISGSEIGMVK